MEVSYTVIHWHENANDDGYSFYAMDTLSGITGEKTQATAKKENVSGKNLLGCERSGLYGRNCHAGDH